MKMLMTKSERMAKTILYKDKVQDLYTICPKMLLQNENYSKGVRQQGKEQEGTNTELSHVQQNILVDYVCIRDISHRHTCRGTLYIEDEL